MTLSVISLRSMPAPPKGEPTPSVIAYGDATFPKGTASAAAGNFAAAPKGVPLGEVDLRSKDGEGIPGSKPSQSAPVGRVQLPRRGELFGSFR